ncbi:hypothetical protein [Streptomyces reniochalinae]|uniref:hypothetical protein n=1 Tax=Streptomyces reniochalinae TaxID=2250578 RepID=UPI001FEA9536|nr:hypothetical protein [Streptomyces reniochalinae]
MDASERLPKDGMPVGAATSGRSPSGSADAPLPEAAEDFWLVMPTVFIHQHLTDTAVSTATASSTRTRGAEEVPGPRYGPVAGAVQITAGCAGFLAPLVTGAVVERALVDHGVRRHRQRSAAAVAGRARTAGGSVR